MSGIFINRQSTLLPTSVVCLACHCPAFYIALVSELCKIWVYDFYFTWVSQRRCRSLESELCLNEFCLGSNHVVGNLLAVFCSNTINKSLSLIDNGKECSLVTSSVLRVVVALVSYDELCLEVGIRSVEGIVVLDGCTHQTHALHKRVGCLGKEVITRLLGREACVGTLINSDTLLESVLAPWELSLCLYGYCRVEHYPESICLNSNFLQCSIVDDVSLHLAIGVVTDDAEYGSLHIYSTTKLVVYRCGWMPETGIESLAFSNIGYNEMTLEIALVEIELYRVVANEYGCTLYYVCIIRNIA